MDIKNFIDFRRACDYIYRGVKIFPMKVKQRMLTAVQFAKEIGASYPTVIDWLDRKLVPGAEKMSDHRGEYWQIPESALNMERPKRGRPSKASTDKKGNVK